MSLPEGGALGSPAIRGHNDELQETVETSVALANGNSSSKPRWLP